VWSSNNWKNYFKQTNTFDANGNVIEFNSQIWVSSWEASNRVQYSYNSSNKQTRSITSSWNYYGKNTWDVRYKDTLVYDVNQNNIEGLNYYFDNSIKKWEPITLIKYKYNAHNDVSQILELDWFMNKWDSAYRTTYSYNSNFQITQELAEKWDESYGLYVYTRLLYSYNSNNNLTQILEENWNPINKVWENYSKVIYSYAGNGNLISESEFLDWDAGLNKYTLELKEEYKCATILATKSFEKNDLNIYPNPANSNSINVNISKPSKYSVYDLFDKLMQTGGIN